MKSKATASSLIRRHSMVELLEHWIVALSGLVLLFSGFGELPMYKRYMLTKLPGLGWAGDFHIQLQIHYVAAMVFVAALVFHVLYHGLRGDRGLLPKKGDMAGSLRTILAMFGLGREPKAHKFLPEQRLAYVFMGGLSLILVVTGIVKVLKNLPGVYFSPGLVTTVTLAHTLSTMLFLLGVLAHLGALLLKANRPLMRAIFTGWVDARYAKERHSLWWEQQWTSGGLISAKSQSPTEGDTGADTCPLGPEAPSECLAPECGPCEAPGSDSLPEPSRAGGR